MKYMATDGKIFNNYDDCEHYEKVILPSAKFIKGYVELFDEDGNLFPIEEMTAEDIYELCRDFSFYVHVTQNRDTDRLDIPLTKGWYRLDDNEMWVSIYDDFRNFYNKWSHIFPNLTFTGADV